MNPPSDPSSTGADSDPGFDFVGPPTGKRPEKNNLPAPKPAKTKLAAAAAAPTRKKAASPPRAAQTTPAIEIQPIDTEREIPQSVAERLHRKRSQLSSFVTSTILHTVVFLVLALWALPRDIENPEIGLIASLDMSDVKDSIEPSPIKFEMPEVAESPVEDVAEDTSTDIEEMASADVPTIVDAIPKEEAVADALDPSPLAALMTLPTGGGLQGRDADSRAKLAARHGGSEGSEAAVENGLRWIINHQLSDGSWRFKHHRSACNGRCGNEGVIDAPNAATGLALMSLLGAGYTHEAGPYQGQVRMGLDYLNSQIRYLNYGGSLGSGPQPMYSHAIATIALAEAYAMTKDETYRKAVKEAYRYILVAQHSRRGGWRYNPQSPGDISVTGWTMMAIKACENAGVESDPETRRLAKQFVDSLASEDGIQYGYRMIGAGEIKLQNDPGTPEKDKRKPTCTAIGNLMQMYFGREKEHPMLQGACQFLADAGSSNSDIYYNYYATLVLHQARAPQWKTWNQTVRDHLIGSQQNHGHEAGSWFFPDLHGNVGGRLYTTAMAVMTLEVYYRFMPLYKSE